MLLEFFSASLIPFFTFEEIDHRINEGRSEEKIVGSNFAGNICGSI